MHRWTEEETAYLTKLIVEQDFGCADATRKLNREFGLELSIAQIRNKVQSCGLYGELRHNKYHKILDKHINYLKENAKDHTCSELTKMLNKEFNTDFECECVRRILTSNEIKYNKRPIATRLYTDEQLKFIEDRKDNTYQEIINDFYKEYGILLLRGSVGYVFKRYGIKRNAHRFTWTQEMKEFLKQNASNMTLQELIDSFYLEFGTYLEQQKLKWELTKLDLCVQEEEKETDFAQTSFNTSKQMHDLVKSTASNIGVSAVQFMKDSFNWFVENETEISPYITIELHKTEPSRRKDYMQAIKLPQSLYDKCMDFAKRYGYRIGDIFLQAILSYTNYIESPTDTTKYDAENWI